MRKYHWRPTPLAKKLELTTERSKAIRWKMNLDDDPNCLHVFKFGRTEHPQYSDNALRLMREFVAANDVDAMLAEYRRNRSA